MKTRNLLKKKSFWVFVLMFGVAFSASAQFNLNKLGKAVKSAAGSRVEAEVKSKSDQAVKKSIDNTEKSVKNAGSSSAGSKAASTADYSKIAANAIYVNSATGSNRNSGTKDQPLKDLQKAVNTVSDGGVILVAEGNYLGNLDAGYIEVKKYCSIIGGYSSDFSSHDPLKYHSMIQPSMAQAGTSGSHGLLDLNVRGSRKGVLLIDGLVFDKGIMNKYCKPIPSNPIASTPEGCETGRMVLVGESPTCPLMDGAPVAQQLIHGDIEGQVIIRNCTFTNGYHFAIQLGNYGGLCNIYNNVFISNRMASCEVRSMNKEVGEATVDFHNNTVLFSWCRDKTMEDMGYGFRFMTGVNADVHNNIFGCTNFGALDRTYVDADKAKESQRKTSAYDNLFFANKEADLMLPSGGGKFLRVFAKSFEDAEQLAKYEGNREMNESEVSAISKVIDAPYLKGFLGMTSSTTLKYNPNSAVNTFRSAMGMNSVGSETTRVSMYANRYPLEKAYSLFGALSNYGAQVPEK